MTLLRWLGWSVLALVALAALVLAGGQAGLLRGSPGAELGVSAGRLAAPSRTPNSVSSQADLFADHPQRAYAAVQPFRPAPQESLADAWLRLVALMQVTPGVVVVSQQDGYLHAEATTRWLRFTDDVELLRDDSAGLIHVRSASRLGRKDLGANRARVEQWRAAFDAGAPSR